MLKVLLFIRPFLFFLTPVYFLISFFRNKLYDFGILVSYTQDHPVISIGNISVGGTGKTPCVALVLTRLEHLIDGINPVVLSRGYNRTTKGFFIVSSTSHCDEVGDEPLMIKRKFPKITVAVSENRKDGLEKVKNHSLQNPVFVLDDGYQRRDIKKDLEILLTTYSHPIFQDTLMPTGNLRESANGCKRADLVIVTKCPRHLSTEIKDRFLSSIKTAPETPLLFSSIAYSNCLKSFRKDATLKLEEIKNSRALVVSGIANPQDFERRAQELFGHTEHIRFPDHHAYRKKDIESILSRYRSENHDFLLTTEKDFMRLLPYRPILPPLYYQEINMTLNTEGLEQLDKSLLQALSKNNIIRTP